MWYPSQRKLGRNLPPISLSHTHTHTWNEILATRILQNQFGQTRCFERLGEARDAQNTQKGAVFCTLSSHSPSWSFFTCTWEPLVRNTWSAAAHCVKGVGRRMFSRGCRGVRAPRRSTSVDQHFSKSLLCASRTVSKEDGGLNELDVAILAISAVES